MTIRFFLKSFAQGGYDDDPVNCEVGYEDDADPNIRGTYPAQPLDGVKLGASYTNIKVCAALTLQLGKTVELAKVAKPRPAPEPAVVDTPQ